MNQHQKSPSFQKELAMVAEVPTVCRLVRGMLLLPGQQNRNKIVRMCRSHRPDWHPHALVNRLATKLSGAFGPQWPVLAELMHPPAFHVPRTNAGIPCNHVIELIVAKMLLKLLESRGFVDF